MDCKEIDVYLAIVLTPIYWGTLSVSSRINNMMQIMHLVCKENKNKGDDED